jgi:stage V sporulation protein AD
VVGHDIVKEFFERDGVELGGNYNDCGLMIYDLKKQDVHAGGSGCGCSAVMLAGHILNGMRSGQFNRVLFAGTGALLSPVSSQQGESIPSVCHAVRLSNTKQ